MQEAKIEGASEDPEAQKAIFASFYTRIRTLKAQLG